MKQNATMRLEKHVKVQLKSFLGSQKPTTQVQRQNDYWKLIGEKGTVIDAIENHDNRILILFDRDLDSFGVANHNPVKNSLWIRVDDLEVL